MAKSAADLIAEHEAEIVKLRERQAAELLKAAPKYPKHIRVEGKENDPGAIKDADGKFYNIVEVKSEAEEKAAGKKGGKTPLPASSVVGEDRKAVAKAEADAKEASDAKARAKKGKK